MKRVKKIALSGCGCLLIWAGMAQADRGQISFQGQVRASTCEINGGDGNLQVTLPEVDASGLNRAGRVAGESEFVLVARNCPPGTELISVFFEGETINTAGRLVGDPGGAQNVELQVANDRRTVMNLAQPRGAQGSTQALYFQDEAILTFFVEYYATGVATPGPVTSRVRYSLDYL